jgi:hydantoinase/carbamoylase family amidase
MRADFDALASIGATGDGGVDRRDWSDAHFAARAWFHARAREEGLDTRIDAAGNHSAVLGRGSRTLLLGSHLDSVPHGGRYDGALGVVAALHVLIALGRAGIRTPLSVEAIDFTDEEGTAVGLLGSWALAGTLTREALAAPRGGRDVLLAGLERAGLIEDRLFDARRDPSTLAGYLELHIEQGPVLERAGMDIGVVTAIFGSRCFTLRFVGEAGHSGTTPMDARRDAGLAAAAFAIVANELVVSEFPGCVATVGEMRFEPGAHNVIPGVATVRLDFRAAELSTLDELERGMLERARGEATARGVELEVRGVGRWRPAPCEPGVIDAVERSAHRLGLRAMRMVSGAGHDAQALAEVAPAGMVFVPSVGGRSHDPSEYTPWESCVNGANVLLGAAIELATGAKPSTSG